MIEGNFAVAQSGGPTSAINASLAGVILAAQKHNRKIYGMINGILGGVNNNFKELNGIFNDNKNFELLKNTPAAYLGSCRYKLPDYSEKSDTYEKIFNNFESLNITMALYIGGNDSMDTVKKLSHYAKLHNKNVCFVGIPKTIDNDLMGTDHTPGFGSAAKFVATSVLEIARDCSVYADRSATIIEIMGRNAGWLTASSVLARINGEKAPHLIYLPERPLPVTKLIEDVKQCTARNIVIAVSEGIKNENGIYYSNLDCNLSHDEFGHAQLSGSAKIVESIIKDNFGIKTRSVELNVLQRCSSHFVSLTDLNESCEIGFAGGEAVLEGNTGIVMGFERTKDYKIKIISNDVDKIANLEKSVPDEFIAENGNDITDKAIEYFAPLILGEPKIETENGIPKHLVLK